MPRSAIRDRLVGVALYGSRARGAAGPYRNVDLLVTVRDLPEHWQERTTALQSPLRGITLDFDFSGKSTDKKVVKGEGRVRRGRAVPFTE